MFLQTFTPQFHSSTMHVYNNYMSSFPTNGANVITFHLYCWNLPTQMLTYISKVVDSEDIKQLYNLGYIPNLPH